MSFTVAISCILDTTNPAAELGFEAWIDEQKFVDIDHVQGEQAISMEMADEDGDHELRFVLKNKTDKHTQIDESGNIISDATLTVKDLAFDEIKLGHMQLNWPSTHTISTAPKTLHKINSTVKWAVTA
jgi:hypothetical protein